MKRQALENIGMSNITLPALYVPIGPVEEVPLTDEVGRQALVELRQRGLKYRVVQGGMALLVEAQGNVSSLLEFEQWLRENSCPAETVE